jgi:hypothetical protein
VPGDIDVDHAAFLDHVRQIGQLVALEAGADGG